MAFSKRFDEAGIEDEDDDEGHNHAEDKKADSLIKNEVIKVIAKVREGREHDASLRFYDDDDLEEEWNVVKDRDNDTRGRCSPDPMNRAEVTIVGSAGCHVPVDGEQKDHPHCHGLSY